MTTLANALSAELQALVDARLDTLDRMLMGRIPRADRLAIVEEVSGQIEEMLARKGRENPDREDVLEVLSRLDPPEAYLAEEVAPSSMLKRTGYVIEGAKQLAPSRPVENKTHWLGAIFAMVAGALAFLVAPLGLVFAFANNSETILFLFCTLPGLVGFCLALAGIILEILNPAKKPWNIVGLTLAGLSIPWTMCGVGYSLLILLS